MSRLMLAVLSLTALAGCSPTLNGRASGTEHHLVGRQARPTSYDAHTIDQPVRAPGLRREPFSDEVD